MAAKGGPTPSVREPKTSDTVRVDFADVPDAPDLWAALEGDADPGSQAWFAAVADRAAAAVTQADQDAMRQLLTALRRVDTRCAATGERREDAGRHALRAVTEVLAAMQDRLIADLPNIRPGSEVGAVLVAMAAAPGATNAVLAGIARLEPSQVSRAGRRLTGLGLAHAARFGRENAWELTPRGRQVASVLGRDAPRSVPRRP